MVLFMYGKSRKAVMNVKSWRESDTLRKSCPRKSIAAFKVNLIINICITNRRCKNFRLLIVTHII